MSLDRVNGDADIYISGVFSLRRPEAIKAAKITHIVSAMSQPVESKLFRNFEEKPKHHHVVDIDDVEDENIIQHFAASNAFIKKGLDGGGAVLVHCAMGKSRSVTLVIAYLLSTLHRSPDINPSYILGLIRQTRPFAEPNPGLMSQLELYYTMNMPATLADLDAHPEYQRWLYHRAVDESNSLGIAPEVGEIRFADTDPLSPLPSQQTSSSSSPSATATTANTLSSSSSPLLETSTDSTPPRDQTSREPQTGPSAAAEAARHPAIINYRCRRCRHQLATSNYIVEHSAGDAIVFPPSSTTRRRGAARNDHTPSSDRNTTTTTTGNGSDPCAHLFVEPLSWMREELEQGKVEGRLECPNPKCDMIVGRYAWQGLKCNCGAWVVPGVSLARGKVDEVREMPVGGAGGAAGGGGGLRRPPPPPPPWLGGREGKM